MTSQNKFAKHEMKLIGGLVLAISGAWIVFSLVYPLIIDSLQSSYKQLLFLVIALALVTLQLVFIKNSYAKVTGLTFTLLLALFCYFEHNLRANAFVSSHEILSLQVLNDYYGDEDGIYIADPNQYIGVSKQGFLSRDFDDPGCDSNAKKIFFLGDSFTWGSNADYGYSYAQLTDSAGYCVYNTGIPSTDPVQYAAIAKKFVPKYKPDLVLLMLCMDNDVLDCERPLVPYQPITYATNGVMNGLLLDGYNPFTCPLEPYASFEDAVEDLTRKNGLYTTGIMGKTALGTQIAKKLKEPEMFEVDPWPEYAVTDIYLAQIDSVCTSFDIPFWIGIIPSKAPEINCSLDYYLNDVEKLFKQYQPEYVFCPDSIYVSDYEPDPNAHLNNSGHQKFANEIVSRLDSHFKNDRKTD